MGATKGCVILRGTGGWRRKVEGERVAIPGFRRIALWLHRLSDGWTVSEEISGAAVAFGRTPKAAIRSATDNLRGRTPKEVLAAARKIRREWTAMRRERKSEGERE